MTSDLRAALLVRLRERFCERVLGERILSQPLFVSPVFLTGCERIPFQGMKIVRMTVAVLPDATDIAMPESLTCHLLLLLPMYRQDPVQETMKTRLLEAINDNRGFWKDDTADRS